MTCLDKNNIYLPGTTCNYKEGRSYIILGYLEYPDKYILQAHEGARAFTAPSYLIDVEDMVRRGCSSGASGCCCMGTCEELVPNHETDIFQKFQYYRDNP